MRLSLLVVLPLFAGACGGAVVRPAVKAVPSAVPVAVTAPPARPLPPPDPPGWFALGPDAPPPVSALVARNVVPALDASGQAWVALAGDDDVRVGRVGTGAPALDPVPGLPFGGALAFGVRGAEPVLAVSDGVKLHVAERVGGAWRVRALAVPCTPVHAYQGGTGIATPVVDRAGTIWSVCVERIPGPYVAPPSGPSFPEDEWDDHPPIGARLKFSRLVGGGFVDVATPSVPKSSRWVEVTLEPTSGALEARIDGAKTPAFALDPQSSKLVPPSAETAPAAVSVRDGRSFGVARAGACFQALCTFVLGKKERAGGEWLPMDGAAQGWGAPSSTPGVAATEPAIALDPSGVPVLAWSEASAIMVRRFDGQAFVALASVPGATAHALAVEPKTGDVLVGRWDARGATLRVARVHERVVTELPELVLHASDRALVERTRLDVRDDGVHVAFPWSGSAPARASFVLEGSSWRAEKLEPFEFSLPYPNTIRPPDFWTPGRVFATRYAAHSALAFDRALHPVIAWAGDDRLHVSLLVGETWSELDGAPAQGAIDGAPAIAASDHRVCMAWTGATPIPSTFVRCHRM